MLRLSLAVAAAALVAGQQTTLIGLNNAGDTGTNLDFNAKYCQMFKTGAADASVTGVGLLLKAASSSNAVLTLTLESTDVEGFPTGTALGSSTLDQVVGATAAMATLSFQSAVTLAGGSKTYAVCVTNTLESQLSWMHAADGVATGPLSMDNLGSLTSGQMVGPTLSFLSSNFVFAVYGGGGGSSGGTGGGGTGGGDTSSGTPIGNLLDTSAFAVTSTSATVLDASNVYLSAFTTPAHVQSATITQLMYTVVNKGTTDGAYVMSVKLVTLTSTGAVASTVAQGGVDEAWLDMGSSNTPGQVTLSPPVSLQPNTRYAVAFALETGNEITVGLVNAPTMEAGYAVSGPWAQPLSQLGLSYTAQTGGSADVISTGSVAAITLRGNLPTAAPTPSPTASASVSVSAMPSQVPSASAAPSSDVAPSPSVSAAPSGEAPPSPSAPAVASSPSPAVRPSAGASVGASVAASPSTATIPALLSFAQAAVPPSGLVAGTEIAIDGIYLQYFKTGAVGGLLTSISLPIYADAAGDFFAIVAIMEVAQGGAPAQPAAITTTVGSETEAFAVLEAKRVTLLTADFKSAPLTLAANKLYALRVTGVGGAGNWVNSAQPPAVTGSWSFNNLGGEAAGIMYAASGADGVTIAKSALNVKAFTLFGTTLAPSPTASASAAPPPAVLSFAQAVVPRSGLVVGTQIAIDGVYLQYFKSGDLDGSISAVKLPIHGAIAGDFFAMVSIFEVVQGGPPAQPAALTDRIGAEVEAFVMLEADQTSVLTADFSSAPLALTANKLYALRVTGVGGAGTWANSAQPPVVSGPWSSANNGGEPMGILFASLEGTNIVQQPASVKAFTLVGVTVVTAGVSQSPSASPTPSVTPSPSVVPVANEVAVAVTLPGTDPVALATNLDAICGLRDSLATVAGVPVSDVDVSKVVNLETGEVAEVPAVPEGVPDPCIVPAGRRRLAHRAVRRLAGGGLTVEVKINVTQSTLLSSGGNSGQGVVFAGALESAVSAAVAQTFSDPAQLDALLATVVQAACSAAGLTSCPAPSEVVQVRALTYAPVTAPPPAAAAEKDNTGLIVGLVVGLGGGLLLLGAAYYVFVVKAKAAADLPASLKTSTSAKFVVREPVAAPVNPVSSAV